MTEQIHEQRVTQELPAILTTTQAVKAFNFPRHRLRALIAEGRCPGFFCGTRFYVDRAGFQALLEEAAREHRRFS